MLADDIQSRVRIKAERRERERERERDSREKASASSIPPLLPLMWLKTPPHTASAAVKRMPHSPSATALTVRMVREKMQTEERERERERDKKGAKFKMCCGEEERQTMSEKKGKGCAERARACVG
jgi:hypothetical protein